MTQPYPITIPLLNPNEPGALLAGVHVKPGQYVHVGDRLCTMETTKSTADLSAESAGYVTGVTFEPGQTVQAGEILCYLAETPVATPPASENTPAGGEDTP